MYFDFLFRGATSGFFTFATLAGFCSLIYLNPKYLSQATSISVHSLSKNGNSPPFFGPKWDKDREVSC